MPSKANQQIVGAAVALLAMAVVLFYWWRPGGGRDPYRFVSTVAGQKGEFGEPFGIAVKGSDIFVSDGANGKIWLVRGDDVTVFAEGLDTPSQIAFDSSGNLLVADTGSQTVTSIDQKGNVNILAKGCAGTFHQILETGVAEETPLNGPVGIAVAQDGRIFFSDTYNDRICVIEKGQVSTLAGGGIGYLEGTGPTAQLNTPTGLANWNDKLLVADTGNRRIRVIEPDGRVWTLAGNGDLALKDGLLLSSSFVQPTAIAVDRNGSVIVADGNAIRQIGGDVIPVVRTISNETRGTRDDILMRSRFNRPSGIAIEEKGDILIADSDNRVVRKITTERGGRELTTADVEALRDKPEEFRAQQPPRWPFDPPDRPRDIAGTLGELRGEVPEVNDVARFHNGLDIAGGYGETARFIRDEKVLQPIAASNFNTLRELLRMPSIGYIHIRLGRDASSTPFGDPRFQFDTDPLGKITNVRVPRGTKFNAGDALGTLNEMNHVHLIAGRSGFEMNALDALVLPGIKDTKPPLVENVQFLSDDNATILTKNTAGRIELTRKARIVIRASDQADNSPARRRLGIYQVGYQVLHSDNTPVSDVKWTIRFDRMPPYHAAKLVYADGSHSGATGETIFNYIVTNRVRGDTAVEDYFDPSELADGIYILRILAADYFGNQSYIDSQIEVKKAGPQ